MGAQVDSGDILVGKVTPKGETDPTPEEKLLKAIFGEKAGNVKDASKRCTAGVNGIVVETQLFERKNRAMLAEEKTEIRLAQKEARQKCMTNEAGGGKTREKLDEAINIALSFFDKH